MNTKNETNRPLRSGRLVSFFVFNSAFGRHMHWLKPNIIIRRTLVNLLPRGGKHNITLPGGIKFKSVPCIILFGFNQRLRLPKAQLKIMNIIHKAYLFPNTIKSQAPSTLLLTHQLIRHLELSAPNRKVWVGPAPHSSGVGAPRYKLRLSPPSS